LLAASGYAYGYDSYMEGGEARQGHAGHTGGNTEHDEHTKGHDAKKETYFLFDRGIFSQFYPSHFVVDDVDFSSAEQYMMYKKASKNAINILLYSFIFFYNYSPRVYSSLKLSRTRNV
jgi:hypothetical protein